MTCSQVFGSKGGDVWSYWSRHLKSLRIVFLCTSEFVDTALNQGKPPKSSRPNSPPGSPSRRFHVFERLLVNDQASVKTFHLSFLDVCFLYLSYRQNKSRWIFCPFGWRHSVCEKPSHFHFNASYLCSSMRIFISPFLPSGCSVLRKIIFVFIVLCDFFSQPVCFFQVYHLFGLRPSKAFSFEIVVVIADISKLWCFHQKKIKTIASEKYYLLSHCITTRFYFYLLTWRQELIDRNLSTWLYVRSGITRNTLPVLIDPSYT